MRYALWQNYGTDIENSHLSGLNSASDITWIGNLTVKGFYNYGIYSTGLETCFLISPRNQVTREEKLWLNLSEKQSQMCSAHLPGCIRMCQKVGTIPRGKPGIFDGGGRRSGNRSITRTICFRLKHRNQFERRNRITSTECGLVGVRTTHIAPKLLGYSFGPFL